jgi:hypothetical protein
MVGVTLAAVWFGDGGGIDSDVERANYVLIAQRIIQTMIPTIVYPINPGGAAPVPEPSTILLVGTGLLGIIGFGRKRLNKKA